MIWASPQSFCTKLIFAKKLQSFMTPLNEWFGLQTSTIAMILYQFCEQFFFLLFLQHAFVLLTDLTDDCMKNWMRAIKKGKLKRFFFRFFEKIVTSVYRVWYWISVLKKINIEFRNTYQSHVTLLSLYFNTALSKIGVEICNLFQNASFELCAFVYMHDLLSLFEFCYS